MAIHIDKPELEALIEQRLHAGGFRSVEDLLLALLRAENSSECPDAPADTRRRFERSNGVWILHTSEPIPASIVDDTIDAVRRERDATNLGSIH